MCREIARLLFCVTQAEKAEIRRSPTAFGGPDLEPTNYTETKALWSC